MGGMEATCSVEEGTGGYVGNGKQTGNWHVAIRYVNFGCMLRNPA